MPAQVILYFDDQADALRFALAAGSVMAGDAAPASENLVQETARISRIRLDAITTQLDAIASYPLFLPHAEVESGR